MNQPVTTLDQRFSDEDAVATSWAETRRMLEAAELFWISTVRADGRPHVTPLVAVWLDGVIYFCTGPTEQKALNLRRNPHVILTTGCNRWDTGLDIVVEGDAAQVSDDPCSGPLAEAWPASGTDDGNSRRATVPCTLNRAVLRSSYGVTPRKILAFAKGDFSHTRHQF